MAHYQASWTDLRVSSHRPQGIGGTVVQVIPDGGDGDDDDYGDDDDGDDDDGDDGDDGGLIGYMIPERQLEIICNSGT